jgi:ParB family chromosome partitioning protein
MKITALASLRIAPGRQRQYFDEAALQDLINSIEKVGLMHPIVVRDDGDKLELVAGERRIRAVSEIWDLGGTVRFEGSPVVAGYLPYVTLGELSELEAEEAQLDENLRRANLTWQEHAAAMVRLESLRKRQSEESGSTPPTLETLAAETFEPKRGTFATGATAYAKETVRKELVVAKYLDRPTVRAAKSLDEAFKVVIREEELARSAELGRSVGATFTRDSHILVNGSCLDVLPTLSGPYDVILTDPPYGMGADSFGDSAGRNLQGEEIHLYRDDDSVFTSVVLPALELSCALAKGQAHAYIFCDLERFFTLRDFFRSLGWDAFRTPLLWIKPDGRVPLPQHGPRRTYEMFLYAYRGKKPTRKVASDTLSFPPDTNLNMAAQKPVALFSELLSRSCLPGDAVLDPFAGTGTILPAAHALKVKATAIELEAKSYGIAVQRMKDLK